MSRLNEAVGVTEIPRPTFALTLGRESTGQD
jgi:hypothetical protein